MSSMTAEQVWALVKDWPREAWPPITYLDDVGYFGVAGRGEIYAPLASYAFIGSGLAWLAKDKTHALCGSRVSTGCYFEPIREWTHYQGEGCLLAAVSAAVLAASDERGGA